MNIPYYEMQRKNVHMIDTNSDLSEQELINKLHQSNLIGRFTVKGKCSVYWVKCSRNDSRIYASKDIQLEVSGNKIFLGANADIGVWHLAQEMMALFYKEFPFSNLREVRNYICGDIDWSYENKESNPKKIFHARQIRKNPKHYGVEA
tara:strand:- start:32 stop:475 length:444 start_codon:yes stop_codon:yes gene_type:complete